MDTGSKWQGQGVLSSKKNLGFDLEQITAPKKKKKKSLVSCLVAPVTFWYVGRKEMEQMNGLKCRMALRALSYINFLKNERGNFAVQH